MRFKLQRLLHFPYLSTLVPNIFWQVFTLNILIDKIKCENYLNYEQKWLATKRVNNEITNEFSEINR